MKRTSSSPNSTSAGLLVATVVFTLILILLFWKSFQPEQALFSNDGPLGVANSEALKLPDSFTGYWADLYWLGSNGAHSPASITTLVRWILGPVGYSKFYAPISLLLLGASAWIFFRTVGLRTGLAIVAALAAMLNMNFFSNTCWGLGTRSLTLASAFLALALLNTRRVGNSWVNAALAGLCVGMGVIEGADNGAIFSLFIAAYVVFQSFSDETVLTRRLAGFVRLGIVGICAALLAAQVLVTLAGIASKTSRGGPTAGAAASMSPEEKEADEERRWVFATQWSLPPQEMLRVIIPGIFGYRMDTPEGGEYWGRVGEYWAMPDGPQRRASRSSGAGEYAGIVVVLIGMWALFHAWRRGGPSTSIFDERERRHVLFWAGMLLIAMILSWGYHAPFYKLVYWLPYFSTIRNPMKFMHVGHMALMILFGYGLLGLSRRYLEVTLANAGSISERFKNWSVKAQPVERWWLRFSVALVGSSCVAYVAYSGSRSSVTRHLQSIGFPDESRAAAIAKFSAGEVGLFVVFLFLSVATVILIQIGMFSGKRAKWAAVCLGLIVTLDLCRANTPWIRHYDFREQYASNPIIERLAKEPWLHRAAVFPNGMIQQPEAAQQINIANQVWRGPWLQYLCQYYNVQSIDMAQDPRPPVEKVNFLNQTSRSTTRLWELTNTRFLIGLAGPFADILNQQLDPVRRSFRVHTAFVLEQTPAGNITARTNTTGPWALIEFGGALPRAKLFTDWQVSSNDQATLEMIGSPSFNPQQSVLVNDAVPLPPMGNSNTAPGSVEFANYAPKRIELKATATAPSMLLLNDQFDRDWSVTVDGQPATLLRCNYLMRGVQVPPGAHTVVFQFQPSLTGMKITLGAFALGLVLCGLLFVIKPRASEAQITNS